MTDHHNTKLSLLDRAVWLLNRCPGSIQYPLAQSCIKNNADSILTQRIVSSYNLALEKFSPSASFWDNDFFALKRDIHDTLVSGNDDKSTILLENPAESTLFWGFDGPTKAPSHLIDSSTVAIRDPHAFVLKNVNDRTNWEELYKFWLTDMLYSLAEAMGVLRVEYPEISTQMRTQSNVSKTVDEIIDLLDDFLKLKLKFPNPFFGEFGLSSTRGVVSFRALQALYQAWRISLLANNNKDYRVLEIGAGLGRTAYFSNLLGIKKYTLIDIPLTNVAQATFLGRVLDGNNLSLYGEGKDAEISIIPNFILEKLGNEFDLVVNVDSFTEMDTKSFNEYYKFARDFKIPILSINHEFNHNTFRSAYVNDTRAISQRYPYWMRRGYVEEIINWC